jgi:organic radical activating enzyme
MVIWTTSDCTLHCEYCNQGYTIEQNKDYQMSMNEVNYIVDSCKKRDIHFGVIELGGGEPTLWVNLKEGIEKFRSICDEVYLTTNGNNPELVISLGLKAWTVSVSQATKKQLAKYEPYKDRIIFNNHSHHSLPEEPIGLPGICCVKAFRDGTPENCLSYICGKVYYCCLAFANTRKAVMSDNIICDFEDDFLTKFSDKTFEEDICNYCVCNAKIFDL